MNGNTLSSISKRVERLLKSLPKTNLYGEKITLVAAVKTQTPQDINAAISAGIGDIGDNRVQELSQKYDQISNGVRRHFIGRLQTNKIKYLIGRIDLLHSLDRYGLATELSAAGEKRGVCTDALLQVNIGCEASKGGFEVCEVLSAYKKIKQFPSIEIKGLMAMLPDVDDVPLKKALVKRMREEFDRLAQIDENIRVLSMGMSGDYELCLECGSNTIRLGTAIFGSRN